jgi:putative acetyltransferase
LVLRNDTGIGPYEKFDSEMEGTHRRFAFRNGKYVDAYSLARLRSANFGEHPSHALNK